MTEEFEDEIRSPKRLKLSEEVSETSPLDARHSLASLNRSITPPARSRSSQAKPDLSDDEQSTGVKVVPSPIQLTYIRDLPATSGGNVGTVRLKDILGDPLIKECWQFNYLHDVDFIMSQFDEDVRNMVQLKVVHGSWKREAPNRIRIDEACARYPNAQAITAYMPEPFGTHHSKMMILLRHDDLAQIVIHTANMIPGDWANMCQAVWQSPLLALSNGNDEGKPDAGATFGTGARFKRDLMAYLNAYGSKKTGPLVEQLKKYDFSEIRAMLIASIPTQQKADSISSSNNSTLWGWPALKDTLRNIPVKTEPEDSKEKQEPHIVVQVYHSSTLNYINSRKPSLICTQISSVATLGQYDKWLKGTFFDSLSTTPNPTRQKAARPKFSVMFPTPDEIRRSLNGYGSGGSIHMKLQSAAQQKQLQYLRPHLCRWAGDDDSPTNPIKKRSLGQPETMQKPRQAGRRRAAPHIKTYIRFADADMTKIDWAMITSANLSTQAWGAAVNSNNEVRICSWEIGVIVWPDLYSDTPGGAEMVPTFQTDIPDSGAPRSESTSDAKSRTTVGFRMPYDLPLTPYKANDMPWCATAAHPEPDWMGQTWEEG
ncbi:hypothetical protein FQN54_002947 [Arachnomyces sp. PD_36]|nr:hypothetical protein FQN54_002947 [Arachnomyces sp. PD_36]